MNPSILLPLLACVGAAVGRLEARQDAGTTATVTLSAISGTPSHLASGFIYGIPDTPNQIPDEFYEDIDFNYARAGGAQVPAPGRGWIWGLDEYKNRFASALSNYRTARKYGANFIFLIHDLWGADGTQNASAPYPGDNGDWTDWDDYLTNWISDVNANDMTPGLSVDIWNEPDLDIFWNRTQEQWIEMYGRTYHRLRTQLPSVPLLGPTLAEAPDYNITWWTNWLAFICTNDSIPDQYVWHLEGNINTLDDDLATNVPILNDLLANYSLPSRPINIDEYATYPEQNPAGAAWWISRLERYNAHGLRGNWLSSYELHDFMASLLYKPNSTVTGNYSANGTGYWPNGEYQVYKYYATNMTGMRLATSGSANRLFDAYATMDTATSNSTNSTTVKVLTGTRLATGSYSIQLQGLSTTPLSLQESGTVSVQTWEFPDPGGHLGNVEGPTDLGVSMLNYSGDALTLSVDVTDNSTAYAFELSG